MKAVSSRTPTLFLLICGHWHQLFLSSRVGLSGQSAPNEGTKSASFTHVGAVDCGAVDEGCHLVQLFSIA